MKRDFLKDLNLAEDVIDRIMKQNGEDIEAAKGNLATVKADLETANKKISGYETEIKNLKDTNATAEDWKQKFEDLEKANKEAADSAAAEKADKELTDAITAVFGDKKFTSDYVRNGIIADMKTEIAKPENKGKGYNEIFETLTKDKEGIFANPNPPADMTGMGNFDTKSVSESTMRAVMGLSSNKE